MEGDGCLNGEQRLVGQRAGFSEEDVKANYWYKYGNRVKWVGLFELPGKRKDETDDLPWTEGYVNPDTGQPDFSTEKHIPFERPPDKKPDEDGDEDSEKSRFRQSIQRARSMVEQYANCNEWAYFITLTLDAGKRDRADLATFRAQFKKLCENVKRATDESISYVIVPELHLDGVNWHSHGLANIPISELTEITEIKSITLDDGKRAYVDQEGGRLSRKQAEAFYCGRRLFRWKRYERNFGFCQIEAIESAYGAAAYCSKMFRYMYKTMDDKSLDDAEAEKRHIPAWKVLDSGKHLYYCSRGLKKREKISPNDVETVIQGMKPGKTYIYEKCCVRWYTDIDIITQGE